MVAIVLYIKRYIHTEQFYTQIVTFYDDVIKQVHHSGCFYLGASLDQQLVTIIKSRGTHDSSVSRWIYSESI